MKIIKKYHQTGSADEVMGLTFMVSQWEVTETLDDDGNVLSSTETKVGGPDGDPSQWYKAVEITKEEYNKLNYTGRPVYSDIGLQTYEKAKDVALVENINKGFHKNLVKDALFDFQQKSYTQDEITNKYGKALCDYITKNLD